MDQVILITDTIPQEILLTVGFIRIPSNSAGFVRIPSNTSPSYKVDNIKFLEHCKRRLASSEGNAYTLHDLAGRTEQATGDAKASIQSYTAALAEKPNAVSTFRNLGTAYHSTGEHSLAFASFQQALTLDTSDAVVYQKLGMFYESLASRDWDDAGDHAQKCYQYYIDNVDPEDTTMLTRLGNLLVREHKPNEAIIAFKSALEVDDTLHNVWFNLAHAQLNLKEVEDAKESLTKALASNNELYAAKHMLQALSDADAEAMQYADPAYVVELYDSYAKNYDEHCKKLRLSTPRVIREEMAKIYKRIGRFVGEGNELGTEEDEGGETCAPSTMGTSEGGCGSHPHVQLTAGPLDVLDLGCGTGLAGGWVKDYCKTMTGVDLSSQMIQGARKKNLYQETYVMGINDYMSGCEKQYDLIVAADVLSYIGDLEETISQFKKVMKPDTYAVFTIEAIPSDIPLTNTVKEKGYRLLSNGRFGYMKEYMDGLVTKHGLDIELFKIFSPRLDLGQPVQAYMYVIHNKK